MHGWGGIFWGPFAPSSHNWDPDMRVDLFNGRKRPSIPVHLPFERHEKARVFVYKPHMYITYCTIAEGLVKNDNSP